MKFYYVTFRSVTHGQRGERLLMKEGIHCSLQRTPKWMENRGCGYSLMLWTNEISRAVELLRRANIPLQKIYIQNNGGVLEEVEL